MNKKERNGYLFLLLCSAIIVITGYISFRIRNRRRKEEGLQEFTLIEFLKDSKEPADLPYDFRSMIFGFIFGAISVLAIWFGLNYLKVFMPNNQMVKIGLSETYGSVFSVILGTFADHIFISYYGEHPVPIWADPLGVLLGGLSVTFIAILLKKHKIKVI